MRIENGEIKNEEFSTQDYPLISRKYAAKRSQPGEPNKFAKGLRQWWIKWIDRMRQTILQRVLTLISLCVAASDTLTRFSFLLQLAMKMRKMERHPRPTLGRF